MVWVLPEFGVIPMLEDHQQFWLLLALDAAVFLPVTLLTPAESLGHLVRYYVVTRPLGFWGPVHSEVVRRGLIDGEPTRSPAAGPRPLIRREWTAAEARDWTREDSIAIVLSPFVMALLMLRVTGTLLLRVDGQVALVLPIAGGLLIKWLIDPKLTAVSLEHEEQLADTLRDLERRNR